MSSLQIKPGLSQYNPFSIKTIKKVRKEISEYTHEAKKNLWKSKTEIAEQHKKWVSSSHVAPSDVVDFSLSSRGAPRTLLGFYSHLLGRSIPCAINRWNIHRKLLKKSSDQFNNAIAIRHTYYSTQDFDFKMLKKTEEKLAKSNKAKSNVIYYLPFILYTKENYRLATKNPAIAKALLPRSQASCDLYLLQDLAPLKGDWARVKNELRAEVAGWSNASLNDLFPHGGNGLLSQKDSVQPNTYKVKHAR